MNLSEVVSALFTTKEAKDLIVNELIKGIVVIINSNKTAINDAVSSEMKIDDTVIRKNFEVDIESISPGNPFLTWDEESSSYKNVQLNLLWQTYKASAYKHCNTQAPDKQYLQFLKQIEDIKKQFSAKNNGSSFPTFPDFTNFPTLGKSDDVYKSLDKIVNDIFKNFK